MDDGNSLLTIRIDAETIALMDTARAQLDIDESDFVRESVREKAQAVIADHQRTVFTADDWTMFFEMLEHAPEPTDRMKRAAQKLRDIVG